MNKKFWYNFLYVTLILAVILALIFIVFWLQGIGVECVRDPMEFYASRTNDICTCFSSP